MWHLACMLIRVISSRSLPRIRKSARAFVRAPGLSFALTAYHCAWSRQQFIRLRVSSGTTHPASPLGGSDSIVSIFRQDRFRGAGPLSADDYHNLKRVAGTFDWIGGARIKPRDTMTGAHAEIAIVAAVTPNLAAALKLPLANGVVSQSPRMGKRIRRQGECGRLSDSNR